MILNAYHNWKYTNICRYNLVIPGVSMSRLLCNLWPIVIIFPNRRSFANLYLHGYCIHIKLALRPKGWQSRQ